MYLFGCKFYMGVNHMTNYRELLGLHSPGINKTDVAATMRTATIGLSTVSVHLLSAQNRPEKLKPLGCEFPRLDLFGIKQFSD